MNGSSESAARPVIRILIADDERLVRRGLRMILEAEPDLAVIGEAADGYEAIDATRRLEPDVVLMDIRMPRLDGLEATRRILGLPRRAPRVIVLTTFDLDEYVYSALTAGASGFLLKDAPEDQLIAAIRVAADGGSMFAPSATRRVIDAFARSGAGGLHARRLDVLTARELEVFRLLAAGRSNREIADTLGVSAHTAKSHVAHILDKLELRDRVQAVVLAYEAGLVQPGGDQPDGGQPRDPMPSDRSVAQQRPKRRLDALLEAGADRGIGDRKA